MTVNPGGELAVLTFALAGERYALAAEDVCEVARAALPADEALAILAGGFGPRLILMDVQLPGMEAWSSPGGCAPTPPRPAS